MTRARMSRGLIRAIIPLTFVAWAGITPAEAACTVPYIFQNYVPGGPQQLIDATQLNADFQALINCIGTGGGGGTGWTVSIYTALPASLTLPLTNLLFEIIRQTNPSTGTPQPVPMTIFLPIGQPVNFQQCIKDGGNNFQINTVVVKTTDGSKIDGLVGSSGYVMNQAFRASCFIWDGATWNVF